MSSARLRVEDPEFRYAAVRLCSDLPLADPDFVRDEGGWMLQLPDIGLDRLEYQLELRDPAGNVQVVCDPGSWAGAMIGRRALPPFRIALVPPGDRDEWYSASAAYGRTLCLRVLPAVREAVPTSGRPVGMGASLGALAMLHAQRTWPDTFGGLFLQSGSFFMHRFDRHESGFPRYARITRFVRGLLRADPHPGPVPVVMTCGREEENIHNNRVIATTLAAGGYPATLHELPDLHNYTGWRDAFDPHLTSLLASLWADP
jgi:enterochelin esterase-like enzyme